MKNQNEKALEATGTSQGTNRRKFLQMSGLALAGTSLLMMGCSDDDDMGTVPVDPNPPGEVPDLGSGNLGILNYAYALEQLEAEFYTQVVAGGYYASANPKEKQILKDTHAHEVIHRDFFKTAITAVAPDGILPDLEFDFSSVDFDSRDAVLGTAVVLEDTGVKAYNGAGQLIDASDSAGATYLLLAGKIVSVEARHASAFRDLVAPGTTNFASDDILVSLGTGKAFDKAVLPADVLAEVIGTGFVKTEFTAKNLPSS